MLGQTVKQYPICNNRLITSTSHVAKQTEEVTWVEGSVLETTLDYHRIFLYGSKYRVEMVDSATGILYCFPPCDAYRVIVSMVKGKLKGEFHVVKRGTGFYLTFYEPQLSEAMALRREARKTKKRQAAAKEHWKAKRKANREALAAKRKEDMRIRKEKAKAAAIIAAEKKEMNRLLALASRKDEKINVEEEE